MVSGRAHRGGEPRGPPGRPIMFSQAPVRRVAGWVFAWLVKKGVHPIFPLKFSH